jgi:hypothetical protein
MCYSPSKLTNKKLVGSMSRSFSTYVTNYADMSEWLRYASVNSGGPRGAALKVLRAAFKRGARFITHIAIKEVRPGRVRAFTISIYTPKVDPKTGRLTIRRTLGGRAAREAFEHPFAQQRMHRRLSKERKQRPSGLSYV